MSILSKAFIFCFVYLASNLLYPSFSILYPLHLQLVSSSPLLISSSHSSHTLTDLLVPAFTSPFDPPVLLNHISSFLPLIFLSSSNNFLCPPPLPPHTTTLSLPSSAKDAHYLYPGTERKKSKHRLYIYIHKYVAVQYWSKCHFHINIMLFHGDPTKKKQKDQH